MRAVCVDDEKLITDYLVSLCREIPPLTEAQGFTRGREALAWLREHEADLVLLDIDMPDLNGIALAAEIKKIRPDTAVIFLTGFSEYAVQAFELRASGYLLKPVRAEKLEIDSGNPKTRLYAVRIDCAGLRPVTGYLSVPRDVEQGRKYPCVLHTHGYSGDRCLHKRPGWVGVGKIVLDINAHGLKLEEFGAIDADTKALRWEIRSNGKTYAFDAEQNKDPEVAYFNGMVLRVKRALQYLKSLDGWNGKDLHASGGSQGGLQTIWAAACREGVTVADSSITWCCDMKTNASRAERKASGDGWYIPWTESMGYYDAVNWAKRIPGTCRTNITRAGLGDYCCPPMGLAKLYNNIPGNKSIKWVQGSRHGYVPPEYEGRDFLQEAR